VLLLAIAAVIVFTPKSEEEELREISIQVRPKRTVRPPESADFAPGREPTYTSGGRTLDPKRWAERHRKGVSLVAFDRSDAARARSGGEGTVRAIERALVWLAEQQDSGAWGGEHRVGLTGLALLAFLGNGDGKRLEVGRGIQFLLEQQKSNGMIGNDTGPYMYGHAIAAIALLEALVLTREESLAAPVAAAVAFSVAAQNESGGWGYRFRDRESDTSVGGWHILLLRLAFARGDDTVIPALNLARERLRVVTDESGRVGYRAPGQFPHGHQALTAVGATGARLSTGEAEAWFEFADS